MTSQPPEENPSHKVCPVRVWCCGNLRTAAICIGITNVISLVLLTSYYLGTTLHEESFNLNMLVIALLVMLLIFANVGLIYGATKRYHWLFLPWLVIYLPAILALLIFCSIKFSDLEGKQLSAILLFLISSYFYAIVVTSYVELCQKNKEMQEPWCPEVRDQKAVRDPTLLTYLQGREENLEDVDTNNKSSPKDSKAKVDCLIDLTEMENLNSTSIGDAPVKNATMTTGDETFSELALRTPSKNVLENGSLLKNGVAYNALEDSGEFTLPHGEVSSSTDFNFSNHFTHSNLLPVPEEVIPIQKLIEQMEKPKHTKEEYNPDQTVEQLAAVSQAEEKKSLSRSSKSLSQVGEQSLKLLPAKSEPRIVSLSKSNVVNMDLVDSTFSPFKLKNGKAAENLPKMKIFLPKNSDDESSGSSSEENLPLKSDAQ